MSEETPEDKEAIHHEVTPVSGLYENWFLDYASYVILERAVPYIEDGLKPVQRRILHAMKEMDDGRFNKVANVIGSTMQYHPHGDASIGEAIVGLGQKELLLDTQGNWGDIRTGDNAAAPRYIEARLSKFALDVVFNEDTTEWQMSYDGRKREPVTLPVKFPLLLAQGVEGIAVGLATKVLPHNFCELIMACIESLKGNLVNLYPDFPTGGQVDVTNYNEGLRGGRLRIRARIEEIDKKTLVIKDIPFGTTTGSVMDSIVKANEAGKIKIKKVIDNTAKDVEIEIQLQPGVSPDITIDALYAFSDCEVSISPNACVIINEKPRFLSVNEILRICVAQTKELLRRELEIKEHDLLERIFFSSLLKIFIREGMYKHPGYESSGTFDRCVEVLNKLFSPFIAQFYRAINPEDYRKLIDKPMSSITRFDVSKADEQMRQLEEEIKQVRHHLEHLTEYAIGFFEELLRKYGKGRERKTIIRTFDTISANAVAAANEKLYINRAEGFIGYSLKKDEYIADCSDIDDIIVFRRDGQFKVVKIGEKVFVGKDILHAGIFRKNDERTVYNMIYLDAKSGNSMVKRFQVNGVTRDKDYDLTMGNKGSRVLYFSANPNGEAETVNVTLNPTSSARVKVYDFDFAEIAIKGRNSQGNIFSRYPVKKIVFKAAGKSTLGGVDIWFEEITGRLNLDKRGRLLGNFQSEDKILVVYKDGQYELTNFELTNRYEAAGILLLEKFLPEKTITAVYLMGDDKSFYVKRFRIETQTLDKKFLFISESKGSKLIVATTAAASEAEITFAATKQKKVFTTQVALHTYIDVKGWKAIGNKLAGPEAESIKVKELETELAHEESILNRETTSIEPGTTVDLDVKPKSQLGLF